jgi:hypothetical protein
MNFSHDDADIVALMRERSRRLVQSVFTCFALLFGALAVAAHHAPEAFSLPADEMPRIAMAFLFLSSGYTLMLFVWDWLFEAKA